MTSCNPRRLVSIGLMTVLTGSAYAQQPPDVVQSDRFGNTAMGFDALDSNVGVTNQSGYSNTAAGDYALFANTSGQSNAACGDAALNDNLTGYRNTAIGTSALYYHSDGDYNVGVGTAALDRNLSGNQNVAVGDSAMYFNTRIRALEQRLAAQSDALATQTELLTNMQQKVAELDDLKQELLTELEHIRAAGRKVAAR